MDARTTLDQYSLLLRRAVEAAPLLDRSVSRSDLDAETASLYRSSADSFGLSWTETDYYDGGSWRESVGGPISVLEMSPEEFAAWKAAAERQHADEDRAAEAQSEADQAARELAQYEALRRKYG